MTELDHSKTNLVFENDDVKVDLLSQTATIAWLELQRFFASGKVIEVKAPLNLVTVGTALVEDDTSQFAKWLDSESIVAVSDALASRMVQNNESVWALAVSPWVLVQQIQTQEQT